MDFVIIVIVVVDFVFVDGEGKWWSDMRGVGLIGRVFRFVDLFF